MSKASSIPTVSPSSETLDQLRARRIRRRVAPLVEQLGGLQSVYDAPLPPLLLRLIGPLCILFGLLILGVFWHEYELLFSWWTLVQVNLLLGVSAVWLLVGLVLMMLLNFSARLRILVCTHGLISLKRRAMVIAWNDIRQFWKDIRITDRATVTRVYTIRAIDKHTLVLNNDIPDVARLGRLIERKVTRMRLPSLLDAYFAGQLISFEQIALQKEGVSIKREQIGRARQVKQGKRSRKKQLAVQGQLETLPWNEIEHISVDDTALSIYRKGQYWDWYTLPVARIPNADILKSMVDTIEYEQHKGPLQRNISLYHANIPVTFGDIRISAQGVDIDHGKIVLAWNELAGVGVGEQEVILKRKGRFEEWYALPLWRVENLEHLKDLVEYILEI